MLMQRRGAGSGQDRAAASGEGLQCHPHPLDTHRPHGAGTARPALPSGPARPVRALSLRGREAGPATASATGRGGWGWNQREGHKRVANWELVLGWGSEIVGRCRNPPGSGVCGLSVGFQVSGCVAMLTVPLAPPWTRRVAVSLPPAMGGQCQGRQRRGAAPWHRPYHRGRELAPQQDVAGEGGHDGDGGGDGGQRRVPALDEARLLQELPLPPPDVCGGTGRVQWHVQPRCSPGTGERGPRRKVQTEGAPGPGTGPVWELGAALAGSGPRGLPRSLPALRLSSHGGQAGAGVTGAAHRSPEGVCIGSVRREGTRMACAFR